MERRHFLVSAAAVGLSLPARAAPVDIDHTYKFRAVDQGDSNLCWLASAAMLMSSVRGGAAISMAELAGELGQPWKEMFQKKGSIKANQVVALAAKLKVRTDGLKSMTADAWASRVAAGPVLLLGYTPGATMGHAVMLAGLKGDTSEFKTLTARIVDPQGGKPRNSSFADLIRFYEGAASANVPQLMFK